MAEESIAQIMYLGDILEQCDFQHFWDRMIPMSEICDRIVGFQDSIRKFVCHVVGITFQTIDKTLLAQLLGSIDGRHIILTKHIHKLSFQLFNFVFIKYFYHFRIYIEALGEKIWLAGTGQKCYIYC